MIANLPLWGTIYLPRLCTRKPIHHPMTIRKSNQHQLQEAITDAQNLIDRTQAAIFDFDGVIADTEYFHSLAYVQLLKDYDIAFDSAAFGRYIGKNEHQIYGMLEEDFGITINHEAAMASRLQYYMQLVMDHDLQPYPFIPYLLDYLQAQEKPIYILSSQKPAILRALLVHWSLLERFTSICTVYDSEERTTKTQLLEGCQSFTGHEMAEVVLFEDSPEVFLVAKRLGLHTVGIIHGLNMGSEMEAEVTINSLI